MISLKWIRLKALKISAENDICQKENMSRMLDHYIYSVNSLVFDVMSKKIKITPNNFYIYIYAGAFCIDACKFEMIDFILDEYMYKIIEISKKLRFICVWIQREDILCKSSIEKNKSIHTIEIIGDLSCQNLEIILGDELKGNNKLDIS